MELDELRARWQQPTLADGHAPPDADALAHLLARQSAGILVKLRRNARLELGANYVALPASLALAALASTLWLRLFGWLLALVAGACIYYFHRKLGLLRDMDDPTDDLRGHLLRVTRGLRALIRFYYRLTLAMIPLTMLVNGLMTLNQLPSLQTPLKAGLVLAAFQVLGAVLYLPTAHTTRRYLHWLYGQHLDQLEASLRELEEEPPAVFG